MSKFKAGDYVVRKDTHLYSGDWESVSSANDFQVDEPREVTGVFGNLLYISGVPWSADFFDLHPNSDDIKHKVAEVLDAVNSPQHYQFFPDLEAIVVIARSMTQEQFYGYCLGNRLKYRLRAGNKDKLEQDIAKSDKYLELYYQHRGECIDAK